VKVNRFAVATLAVIQPEAVVALLTLSIEGGRWDIGRDSIVETPADFDQGLPDTNFASKRCGRRLPVSRLWTMGDVGLEADSGTDGGAGDVVKVA